MFTIWLATDFLACMQTLPLYGAQSKSRGLVTSHTTGKFGYWPTDNSPLSQGGHIAPGDQKSFVLPSLIPMVSIARLSVVKQSSFGLPGEYGRRVTRVNNTRNRVH